MVIDGCYFIYSNHNGRTIFIALPNHPKKRSFIAFLNSAAHRVSVLPLYLHTYFGTQLPSCNDHHGIGSGRLTTTFCVRFCKRYPLCPLRVNSVAMFSSLYHVQPQRNSRHSPSGRCCRAGDALNTEKIRRVYLIRPVQTRWSTR